MDLALPAVDECPANSSDRLATWERVQYRAMAALPAGMLVFSVAIAVAVDAGDSRTLIADLALGGGGAVLLLLLFRLRPPSEDWAWLRPIAFTLMAGLSAAMVLVDPVFGFFAWTGYLQVFSVLRGRWRLPGLIPVALVVSSSQVGGWPLTGGTPWEVYAGVAAVNAGVAGAITWFARAGSEQSEQRARLVDELTDANRRLSETVAENAGLHQQLVNQARKAGVVDERRRMAREIHDTLAQGLTGIITQLQATEGSQPGDDRWHRHIDAALALARESLTGARRSMQALRPAALEEGQLPDALADVAAQWSRRQPAAAELRITGDPEPLAAETEVTLLRAVQEALANVAKHAGAHRVAITLSYLDDVVTLDVRDDGVGFDRAALAGRSTGGPADGTGFGLTAMGQRIAARRGTLVIESEPGAGTAISVSMPTGSAPAGDEPVALPVGR